MSDTETVRVPVYLDTDEKDILDRLTFELRHQKLSKSDVFRLALRWLNEQPLEDIAARASTMETTHTRKDYDSRKKPSA